MLQASRLVGERIRRPPAPSAGPTVAYASPAEMARSVTFPFRLTGCHVVPPSCVAYRSGPYAKPFLGSANRNCEYPAEDAGSDASFAGGAWMGVKLRPPLVVRMIAPHEGQLPGPSNHQVSSPIALNDRGAKCVGSAGAVAGAVADVVRVAVRAAVVLERAVLAACRGLLWWKFSSTIATTAATTATAARTARACAPRRRGGRGGRVGSVGRRGPRAAGGRRRGPPSVRSANCASTRSR